MNADSIYLTGSTHTNCQDYAAVSHTPAGVIAALSDGCSSSPKTDVGARILVESLLSRCPSQLIKTLGKDAPKGDRDIEFHLFAHRIMSVWDAMKIPNSAFDATLLGLIHADGKLVVIFWGDGLLRIQHKNGDVTTLDVDYDRNQNAPYYPAYDMFPDRRNSDYRAAFGEPRATRDWKSPMPRPAELEHTHPIFELPTATIESVSIFSDGVSSFLKDREPLTAWDISDQCCDFKSTEGQLVTRRINKCRKNWAKEGVQHLDDFSMATIHFPDAEKPSENNPPLD